MRTTVEIPDALMKDALRVYQAKTKRTVIILGLQELIKRHKLDQLRALGGRIQISTDLRKSRKR